MDYIYAKLNEKLAENQSIDYVPTEIENSATVLVTKTESTDANTFRLDVDTRNLVRLLPIQGDLDVTDDVKQRFRLFAYNVKTNGYDIPLGDEIVIDHSNYSGVGGNIEITHALIAGQKVPASIDNQGQLVLQYIPINAVTDTIYQKDDSTGEVVLKQIESIIDGND